MGQADDRRAGYNDRNRLDLTAPIKHQARFPGQDQSNRPAGCANMDRLEIRVENQNWFVQRAIGHGANYIMLNCVGLGKQDCFFQAH